MLDRWTNDGPARLATDRAVQYFVEGAATRETNLARPIVFLGPTLPRGEAEQILDADYRPPLRVGDLDQIEPSAIVGIIDGVLEGRFRISLCDVRRAIERGVRFFGAASTGALLAKKIGLPGIVGIGRVFAFLEQFEGDGEELIVALYAEHDNMSLTIPLINVVLAYGQLRQKELELLAASLCEIPLECRTFDCIDFHLRSLDGFLSRLPRIRRKDLTAKTADARLLLQNIKRSLLLETSDRRLGPIASLLPPD